ncbi:MAG: MFS transporter, partial [Desulfobacteraceae bacterium]
TLVAVAAPTMVFGLLFYWILGRLFEASGGNSTEGPPGREVPLPGSRRNRLAPFILISTFTHAVSFCVVSFIPLFLIDQFALGEKTAAAFLSIFYSAGLWASLTGGMISDRLGAVPVVTAVCLISGPLIYLLDLAPSALGIGFLLFVLGICNYVRTPVSESYLVSRTSARHRSTVLGLYYFFNIEGGGLLTPIMGFLIDRHGFRTGFSVAAASLVLVTLICFLWMRADSTRLSS